MSETSPPADAWPQPEPAKWGALLARATEQDMAGELAGVRVRQENRLRRELERVDDYFENYERELAERAGRGGGSAKIKLANRLAVAKAEHARHRADQVGAPRDRDRAVCGWASAGRGAGVAHGVQVDRAHQPKESLTARFVPRARRWEVGPFNNSEMRPTLPR